MTHVGSKEDYAEVLAEVDSLLAEGYVFCIESISGMSQIPLELNAAERHIDRFLKWHAQVQKHATINSGLKQQNAQIDYKSKKFIVADISNAELVREMYSRGFRVKFWLLWLLDLRVSKDLFSIWIERSSSGSVRRTPVTWFVGMLFFLGTSKFKVKKEVIVNFRNSCAIKKIEQYFQEHENGKMLLHYGRNHRDGILRHLLQKGWNMINR